MKLLISIICVFYINSVFADNKHQKINLSYDWTITSFKFCPGEFNDASCPVDNRHNDRRVIHIDDELRLDMTPWIIEFKVVKKDESMYLLKVDATDGNISIKHSSEGEFNTPHDINFESGEHRISGRIFVGKKA
jgi:hypothetical protein